MAFVDDVLAATGSATVDIVGHSQGGMIRFDGGTGKVTNLVTLGATHHGSEFLNTLRRGWRHGPGVHHTVIATRFDEVTTPYRSTFLTAGPGATVENITPQDGCPIDLSDHLSMSYSPRAIGHVRRALDPSAPAAPCLPHLPVV